MLVAENLFMIPNMRDRLRNIFYVPKFFTHLGTSASFFFWFLVKLLVSKFFLYFALKQIFKKNLF